MSMTTRPLVVSEIPEDTIAPTRWTHLLKRLIRNPGAVLGFLVVSLFIFASIAASWISPHDYDVANFAMARRGPSATYWLGNDEIGRDLLSRLIHGARLSLIVGLISVSIGLAAGVPLGLLSGYFGGLIDQIIMRLIDIMLAFPSILLAILLVAVYEPPPDSVILVALFGPSLNKAMLAIGIVSIPIYARLVRSSTLAIKGEMFIEASRAMGAGDLRIILQHVLPNTLAPILVQSTLQIAAAIQASAALGFLGLGAPPDVPEWGNMLQKGRTYIVSAPHIVIFPGLATMFVVLGFNLLGDALRDVLDPRLSR
jgi:peptide/nickel transport system permease protein